MQANGKETGVGGIRHKLGSLFSPRGTPPAVRGREDHDHGIFITADVLRELEEGVPTQRRVRAMRELIEIVASKRLEEYAVQAIWKAVCDLLQDKHPADVRHAVLHFTQAMVAGQYSELGMMRAHFFKVIQSHRVGEDTQQRLELLVALTQGGKDIQHFEEVIGPFLVEWMPGATSLARAEDFLGLLVKLVHYNSAYLDEDVLSQLVSLTCSLANQSTVSSETELCLSFLDAVICYSVFPTDTIHTVIVTLCHTLNIERFIQRSLEVMQRLLGTHLGHTVIYTMCSVLQDKASASNVLLLRGAVFFTGMSLWGVKRVDTLTLPFIAVLPAILQASLSGHTIVVYEVVLSMLRLVRHYAPQLDQREWEMIHRVLHATQHHLTLAQQVLTAPREGQQDSSSQLQSTLQDVYCSIEQYWERGHNSIGPAHLFFQLLDEVRAILPEQSALSLVHYHTQVIDTTDLDWLQQITDFMDKFYRCERRSVIRREALGYLAHVMADHWLTQEEPLVNHVLLPFLKPLPLEMDSDLRCQAVQLLMQFLPSSSTAHALSMLALLTQVLARGLQEGAESRLPDCRAAVFGLTQLLKEAVYRPGPLAGEVFSALVQFLRQLYTRNCFTATSCVLRINVFNCLLSMRADQMGQVGFYDKDISELKYSPFHVCTPDGGLRSMPFSRTVLHLGGVFEAVMACLLKDVEWEAVFQLLHLLRDTFQCRPLTLSAMPDLSPLLPLLSSLADTHSPRLKLFNTNQNVAEVAGSVYPLLALLATYPAHLHRRAQHDLVCCLEAGLVGKQTATCMAALTVCSLELQATMKRFLPRVLYRLGQVAATPSMATPTLEFLASLIPIPALVSGFVEEEYLSVFGIALPYSNPDRYSPYVVAMAHHVISMWFLRCRIRYRPRVARFISKGMSAHMTSVEGTEDRDRLCQDLTETTLDVLARYTYSTISSLPSRSSGAEFLMSGGPSKTWALSNYLITVTTAGDAGGKPGRCAQCVSNLGRDISTVPSSPEGREGGALHAMAGGLCSCWGLGWAEVKVRRPSGNTAWMLHLQNRLQREQPLGKRDGDLAAVAAACTHPTDPGEGGEGTVSPAELESLPQERSNGELGDRGKSEECENEADQLPWQQTPFPWQLIIDHEEDIVENAVQQTSGPASPVWSPTALERMPPLLSYEEGPAGRSPSLHSSLLTEQEQLNLVARVYRSSECESSGSSGGGSPEPAADQEERGATGPAADQEERGATGPAADQEERGATGPAADQEERGATGPAADQEERGATGPAADQEERGATGPAADQEERGATEPAADQEERGATEPAADQEERGATEPAADQERGATGEEETIVDGGEREGADIIGGSQEHPLVKEHTEEAEDSPSLNHHTSSDYRSSVPVATDKPSPEASPSTAQHHIAPDRRVPDEAELPNDPSFVFLQLFHSSALSLPQTAGHTPRLLPADEVTSRAVKILDLIPPYNTHKIGVVYVGKGQTSEAAILANTSGSSGYQEFLSGLGLDRGGSDGEFTYLYHDDTTQVVFHVATIMPTLTSDPQCSNKKLHIGNDFVTLVYNESGRPYQFGTIKGQFSFAEVVVEPLVAAVNRVCVTVCSAMEGMLSVEPSVCSSHQLPILARTKALQANFASLVHLSSDSPSLSQNHPSNWLCRLRQIRHIRERCTAEPPNTLPDFTTYS